MKGNQRMFFPSGVYCMQEPWSSKKQTLHSWEGLCGGVLGEYGAGIDTTSSIPCRFQHRHGQEKHPEMVLSWRVILGECRWSMQDRAISLLHFPKLVKNINIPVNLVVNLSINQIWQEIYFTIRSSKLRGPASTCIQQAMRRLSCKDQPDSHRHRWRSRAQPCACFSLSACVHNETVFAQEDGLPQEIISIPECQMQHSISNLAFCVNPAFPF